VNPRGLRRSFDSIDNEWSSPHHDVPDPVGERAVEPSEWQVNAAGREVVAMSAAEIITKLRSGELDGQALAWREGMETWTALDALPAFQLAAPQSSRPLSSRPAESEARLKQTEDVLADTEMTAPRAQISIPEEAATDEATVVRDPETLPPPPLDDTNPGGRRALAVYERPLATLAFPDLDAPPDEETIVSELGPESTEPPKASKPEEPPVPPLPKLPSRALVSTATSAFMPPSSPPVRSPTGAPRLSSLGPSTGARPSTPSSPSPPIGKKPLAPASGALGHAATPAPAPLVQALLTLAESSSEPPPGQAAKKPPVVTAEPSKANRSDAPPAPSARAESGNYRPPLKTELGLGPAAPSPPAKPAFESVKPALAAKAAPSPATTTPVASPRRHTPPSTPLAKSSAMSPAPAVSASSTPARAAPTKATGAEVASPVVPAAPKTAPAALIAPPPAAVEDLLPPSDPEAAMLPPPLPARDAVAVLAAQGTPTIILREDRDADTLITNFRPRTVRVRHAVMACAASAVVASLFTALVMPRPDPVVRVVEKRVTVPAPVTAAPAVVEAPAATPPAEAASAPAPEATTEAPRVSARQLAMESKPARETRATPAPRPKVVAATLSDPERALPDSAEPTAARAPSSDETTATGDSDAPAKPRGTWQTSPGF